MGSSRERGRMEKRHHILQRWVRISSLISVNFHYDLNESLLSHYTDQNQRHRVTLLFGSDTWGSKLRNLACIHHALWSPCRS